MKVLFVVHDLSIAGHIAIAYLSAVVKQLDCSTYFCSLGSEDLAVAVRAIRPEVIRYSTNVIGGQKTIEAYKEVGEIHNFVSVSIVGGPQVAFPTKTFSESLMDAYCVGEGQYAFGDFLVKVEKGGFFDGVENLIAKNRENPVRPSIRNLDKLPPADRDLIISSSFLKAVAKKVFYTSNLCVHRYNIRNRIFRLPEDYQRGPRLWK